HIADAENHRIRKVDLHTGIITTIAGSGTQTSSVVASSVAASSEPPPDFPDLDPLAEPVKTKDEKVVQLSDQSGMVRFVTGAAGRGLYKGDGGPALQAGLSGPSGLAVDGEGNLYIADTFNGRIRKVDVATGLINTVAGDGTEYRYQGMPNEFSTGLSRPAGIALGVDGRLYITDSDNHLIRMWNPKTKIITAIAGNGKADFGGDGGPATAASLSYPLGGAV